MLLYYTVLKKGEFIVLYSIFADYVLRKKIREDRSRELLASKHRDTTTMPFGCHATMPLFPDRDGPDGYEVFREKRQRGECLI